MCRAIEPVATAYSAANLIALLKPHAGLAVAGVSRDREDNAGTVKRVLNCDERAGMRIGPLQHAASAYFPALSFLCDRRNRRETTCCMR